MPNHRVPAVALIAVAASMIAGSTAAKKAGAGALPVIAVSSAALRGHVEALARGEARAFLNPERLDEAARYVETRLAETGLPTAVETFAVDGTKFHNVIAVLNPDKSPIVVVGAHYDVCGDQPGADDNASGVAGLIELASALAPHGDRLPFQVQFAAYPNEEPPFFATPHMGSFRHARALKEAGARVKLMVSMEMIGYFSDEKGSQRYPIAPLGIGRPKTGNYIAAVSKWGSGGHLRRLKRAFAVMTRLPVETMTGPRFVTGLDFSDHRSFWEMGFPAIMVTDTAFYRNPNYHRVTDTPETLDYGRMAEVVRGLAAFLLRGA